MYEKLILGPAPQGTRKVEKGDKTVIVDSDVKATPKKNGTAKKDETTKKVENPDSSKGEEKPIDVDEKCKDDTLDGEIPDVIIVSETPAGLSEREKRDLKSRYALPDSPHLLVYPSSTARGGKFQAVSLSLSVLLDYRIEDAKEHSFEVFLFAELFNEMLMRDFIFNIYKALTLLPDKVEEKKDKKKSEDKDTKKEEDKDTDNKKEDDSAKPTDKKDEKNSTKDASNDKKSDGDEKKEQKDDKNDDDDMQVSDGEDEKKSTTTDRGHSDSRRGRKRRALVREPLLLMSFLYFDITRAGHITSGDMEKMLSSLGLQLSRAQIKKLLAKVLIKDNFYYKRLTEEREGEPNQCPDIGSLTLEALRELALGNRCMVPITHSPGSEARADGSNQDASSGMVTYAGRVVDLEKLLSQLASSEASRRQLESRLVDLKKDNKVLQEKYNSSSRTERSLASDLDASKVKLNAMQMKLNRTLATTSIFHCTMKDIQTKIDAVISIPFQDEIKLIDVDEEKVTGGVEEIKEDSED